MSVLAVTWLLLTVAGYYVWHKPIGPQDLFRLSGAAANLGLPLLLMAGALGVGARLLPQPTVQPTWKPFLQLALGWACLALVLVTLGAMNLLTPVAAWLVLGLALVAGFGRYRQAWKDLAAALVGLRPSSSLGKILAIGVAFLVLAPLAEALAPPVHFDALVYHLHLPQVFATEGGVGFIPDNPFWGQPWGGEMLFSWAWLLRGPEAAAVLGWLIGLAALLSVMALTRQLSAQAPWVAAAAMLCGYSLWAALGWAYVDWLALFYGAGLLLALVGWRTTLDGRLALLVGLLAGAAIGAKLTAGVGLIAGLVVMVSSSRPGRGRSIAVALAGGALFVLPWLIKNWLGAGHPLYPHLGLGHNMTPERSAFFSYADRPLPIWLAAVQPLAASWLGVEGAAGYAASIGPLLMGLAPAALLRRRNLPAHAGAIARFLLVGWLVWATAAAFSVILSQTRLYFVLFPAWAYLAALGFDALGEVRIGRVRLGRLAASLVVVVLAMSVYQALKSTMEAAPWSAWLGGEPRAAYLARRLGPYARAMQQISQSPEELVLLLWEPRGLYCYPTCSPDSWIDRWWLARRAGLPVSAQLEQWRSAGYRQLLVNQAGVAFLQDEDDRYLESDWQALHELLATLPLVESFGGAYELYRLAP